MHAPIVGHDGTGGLYAGRMEGGAGRYVVRVWGQDETEVMDDIM